MRRCLKCKRFYKEPPALSRLDGKMEICPLCSTKEALDAAGIIEGSSVRKMVIENVIKNMKPCYSAGKKVKSAKMTVCHLG